MVLNDTRHIVIACSFHWGHLKGLCMLSARFVRLRPTVTVTLFTSPVSYDKVQAEISRGFSEDEQLLRDRIQVVVLAVDPEKPWNLEVFDDKFIEQYAKLLATGGVWCEKAQRSVIVGNGRAPDAVIVAIFAYKQLLAARRLQPGVKVLCWFPSPTCGIIPMMGPLGPDTKGLRRRIVKERMAKTGESFEEAAHNALTVGLSDKIINGPGLPPMYSTETRPQQPYAGVSAAAKFFIPAADLFHEADGVIVPSFEAFDPPESVKAMRDFLAFTNRKFYAVGPLMPSGGAESAAKGELRQSSKAQETEAFMERTLRTRGEKSLVYMAFGSAFWPSDPTKIWAFVETLLEKNIPFIFAHASDSAEVPAEIRSKVEAAGLGFLTSWAPQQLILNHPVTGWFVTHCGINSIMETISAGVPMIAWPFGAEQPYNALHCSVTLNIAFELLEVRTGKALKVYRTGKTHAGTLEAVRAEAATILDQAFGPEGEVKRRNILKLREAAEQAWSKGGPSKKAVEDILEAL